MTLNDANPGQVTLAVAGESVPSVEHVRDRESSAHDGSVVPRDLRLAWRGRWRAANVLARRQGTPLARTIPPWRWIAASVWFLTLTMGRATTAGIGRACVTTQTITKRHRIWYPVIRCGSIAVIVFSVAVLVARPVDVLRGIGLPGSPLLLMFIVGLVENVRYIPLFWRRRHATDRATAAVRSAGHTGTLAVAEGLVSENTGDVIELGRRWLRHVDEHGIALIAVARTERIARAYAVQGFQQVTAADPLLLIRLPRSG